MAARYGNVPPDVFDELDYEEGADLAMRVIEMHNKDLEFLGNLITEHAKATIKAVGARVV